MFLYLAEGSSLLYSFGYSSFQPFLIDFRVFLFITEMLLLIEQHADSTKLTVD